MAFLALLMTPSRSITLFLHSTRWLTTVLSNHPCSPSVLVLLRMTVVKPSSVALITRITMGTLLMFLFVARRIGKCISRKFHLEMKNWNWRTLGLLLIPVWFTVDPHMFPMCNVWHVGTSLIVLPTDIAEMLNTQIGAKRTWNG